MATAATEQRVFERGLNSEEVCYGKGGFDLQGLSLIINRNIGSIVTVQLSIQEHA